MNDDIQEVRRLLAPANPSPRGALNGAGQDAVGRAAFTRITTETADAPSAGRSPVSAAPERRGFLPRRAGVRLVAVGGLALAIAAGTTVAQNLGGTDENGKPRPVLPGLPVGPAANAQVVLNNAAAATQARPFTTPRPDQWIFVETRYRRIGVPGKGEVRRPGSPAKTEVEPLWTRADGRQMAMLENGKLVTSPTGGGSPPSDYASVAKLPRDPDKLLAWASADNAPIAGGPDALAFKLLSSVLSNNGMLPPAQEASIYRALAKIDGITLNKAAVDAQGRPALSVAYVFEGWIKEEILLDKVTYAYRGHRSIAVKDHTFPDGGTFKKGTVESQSARLAGGVVDRPGQRP